MSHVKVEVVAGAGKRPVRATCQKCKERIGEERQVRVGHYDGKWWKTESWHERCYKGMMKEIGLF